MPLRRLALRLCFGRKADADDLVQDTLERAHRSFDRFEPGTSFQHWIKTILRNRRLDLARRSRRDPVKANLPPQLVQPDAEHEQPWTRVSADEIREALTHVKPAFRLVFELREVHHLSYDDISARLGISRSTVGTRLLRARRSLREALESRLSALAGSDEATSRE